MTAIYEPEPGEPAEGLCLMCKENAPLVDSEADLCADCAGEVEAELNRRLIKARARADRWTQMLRDEE